MLATTRRFHKAVCHMERGLPPNKLVPALRASLDEFRLLLPVIGALRNPALKERHWARVCAAIGTQLPREEGFTLQVRADGGRGCRLCCVHAAVCTPVVQWRGGARCTRAHACAHTHASQAPSAARTPLALSRLRPRRLLSHQVLLDARVVSAREPLSAISTEASQEAALEALLAGVVAKWAGLELPVIPYKDSKDVLILGGIDDIQARVLCACIFSAHCLWHLHACVRRG